MSKLPLLNAKQVCKSIEKAGFTFRRQKGSHMFYEHEDGRTTLIPNHPGEEIDRGLLNKIVKHDLRMGRDEFLEFLK